MLKDRLGEVRRRSFVGRSAELALFQAALSAQSAPGVIFVHGPGGIGKSALLTEFAALGQAAGRSPVRIDARHLRLSPDAFPSLAGHRRPLLLIDTYELLAPIDDWVREEYLPSLPEDVMVVIAGRHPPGPRGRADPAWRSLMQEVVLGNLSPDEGRSYLAVQGMADEALLRTSHGHPLTLSMLVDAVRRGLEPVSLEAVPDVVAALLAQTVEAAPTERHRAALEVCAHVPVTTEGLLRSVVEDPANELFTWLRALPFVAEGPYGLYPHDVIRDALDADLRWRDPQRYAELDRRLAEARLEQLLATTDEGERLRMVVDSIVLGAARSRSESCTAPSPTLQAYVDDLRESDRAPIRAMTRTWHGAQPARTVEIWLDRRPEAFRVFRAPSGEPRGYALGFDLTEADLGVDPEVDRMGRLAPRAGEGVRVWRFFLDGEHGQQSSPSATLFAACQILDGLTGPTPGVTLVAAYADAELWGPTMANLDFWPVGEPARPVFAHDWRRRDPEEWLRWMHARHTSGSAAGAEDRVVLSQNDFAVAVRSGRRALHRPARLAGHPLLRSRVLERYRTPAALFAAAPLPPDLKNLVERTFLHPTTTQERVAEELHLSFNTFRRHRDQAVSRIVAWSWDLEISAGRPGSRGGPGR